MDRELHLKSAAEMDHLGQNIVVKEKNIKEEPYNVVIGCEDEEENPSSELKCNVTRAHIAEDGTYCKEDTYFAECGKTATETDMSSDETTAVEIEVKLEDDEEEQHSPLGLSKSLLLFYY